MTELSLIVTLTESSILPGISQTAESYAVKEACDWEDEQHTDCPGRARGCRSVIIINKALFSRRRARQTYRAKRHCVHSAAQPHPLGQPVSHHLPLNNEGQGYIPVAHIRSHHLHHESSRLQFRWNRVESIHMAPPCPLSLVIHNSGRQAAPLSLWVAVGAHAALWHPL